jgi:ketosteroid isomerase-like protein
MARRAINLGISAWSYNSKNQNSAVRRRDPTAPRAFGPRLYSGCDRSVRLDRGDRLAVHPSADGRVVTLEYEVHSRILKSGVTYDNRFVSIAFIEKRKVVRWRDYMDCLADWTALSNAT